jgi:SAM-dependent methyltransferase
MSTPSAPQLQKSTAFDSAQYDLCYSPGVERHFWHYARWRIVERHLRKLNSQIAGDAALVLDVGCGVGLTVGYLRGVGIDCRGVELGRPAIRPGLEDFVTTGTDACELPFDIRRQTGTILLLDVIEHIEDPIGFIGNLRDSFPRLARILITVPARAELWSNYDVHYGHFLRYDKEQVRTLAFRAGLELVVLRYFFVGLYPIAWLLSRLVRHRSVEVPRPSGLTALLHRLAGLAFLAEERLPFVNLLPGMSLLAVFAVRQ